MAGECERSWLDQIDPQNETGRPWLALFSATWNLSLGSIEAALVSVKKGSFLEAKYSFVQEGKGSLFRPLKVRLEGGQKSRRLAARDRSMIESEGNGQHAPHRWCSIPYEDPFLASARAKDCNLRRDHHQVRKPPAKHPEVG